MYLTNLKKCLFEFLPCPQIFNWRLADGPLVRGAWTKIADVFYH